VAARRALVQPNTGATIQLYEHGDQVIMSRTSLGPVVSERLRDGCDGLAGERTLVRI
jgi:hypothetical protein